MDGRADGEPVLPDRVASSAAGGNDPVEDWPGGSWKLARRSRPTRWSGFCACWAGGTA